MISIVTIVLSVMSALLFIIPMPLCILIGYKRGLFNSALRLSCSITAALLAFLFARLLSPTIGSTLSSSLIAETLKGESLAAAMSSSGIFDRLIAGLLAPLMFCFLYLIIDKLMLFAYFPLKNKFKQCEALHNVPRNRLFGAILGGVLALTITVTCVMPIGGYIAFADDAITAFSTTSAGEDFPDELTSTVEDLAASPVVTIDYGATGWLFRGLAVDGIDVVDDCVSMLSVVDKFNNGESAESIEGALKNLPPSSLATLASIGSGAISEILPEEQTAFRALLTEYFETLSDADKMSKDQYEREIEALSVLLIAANDTEVADFETILYSAMKSDAFSSAVENNQETLKQELSQLNISKTEKKKLETMLETVAESTGADADRLQAYKNMFGLS